MSERDIEEYFNRNRAEKPKMRFVKVRHKRENDNLNFSASHIFCTKCNRSMPVTERLLLYLPDGDLYDFRCNRCGTSVGTKKVKKSL